MRINFSWVKPSRSWGLLDYCVSECLQETDGIRKTMNNESLKGYSRDEAGSGKLSA